MPLPRSRPETDGPPAVVVLGADFADSFSENIALTLDAMGIPALHIDVRVKIARGKNPRGVINYLEDAARRFEGARDLLLGRRIAKLLREIEPVLVISTDGYLTPGEVAHWRALTPSSKWVLWFPDALSNLGSQPMLWAPYDVIFFKDPYLVDALRERTELPVAFLPEACNPQRHRSEHFVDDSERTRFECDVMVAGNLYAYRERVIECLPRDIHLKVYGNLPRTVRSQRVRDAYTGLFVTDRDKALAFRGAKVVLNTMHFAEIASVNNHLFEATACGGFVLTSRTQGLDGLFVEGTEVVAFSSKEEMRDAVTHYLDSADRTSIAAAGQARSHRDHSYENRLRELFRVADTAL